MTKVAWPVLFFAEGDYSGMHIAASRAEAVAFCEGLSEGSLLYGAGSCAAYIWPEEEIEMREDESKSEVERALVDLADRLERRRLDKEGFES